jgi:hypothetical protein
MPEIAYNEYKSCAEHTAMLEQEGFRVTTGLAGIPTAVMGEAGEGGVFRGDRGGREHERRGAGALGDRCDEAREVGGHGREGRGGNHETHEIHESFSAPEVRKFPTEHTDDTEKLKPAERSGWPAGDERLRERNDLGGRRQRSIRGIDDGCRWSEPGKPDTAGDEQRDTEEIESPTVRAPKNCYGLSWIAPKRDGGARHGSQF